MLLIAIQVEQDAEAQVDGDSSTVRAHQHADDTPRRGGKGAAARLRFLGTVTLAATVIWLRT